MFGAPQPPSAALPLVAVSGTVDELIVDDRVTGTTTHYLVLRAEGGKKFALDGTGLQALAKGAKVEVIGRPAGASLFVTDVRWVAPAPKTEPDSVATATVQGIVTVFHADYFAEGRGEYGLVVQGDDGQATPLSLAVVPESVRAGKSVIASGSIAADGFSLDVNDIIIVALPPPGFNGVAEAPTTNNVLVIPIKFTDSPASDAFTPTTIDTEFQTKVAPLYQEQSFDAQLLNVTVACKTTTPAGCAAHTSAGGWLLAGAATPANCNYTSVASLADSTATAAGYTLSNYKNRFYVMPYNSACGWAGLAYVGSPYQAWGNGYYQLWVTAHELGHNFTLWHSGSLYCPGQSIGPNCVGNYSVNEYGDPFDAMGNIYPGHFNAMQKSKLNWLPAGSVKTHSSGTASYTLSPIESPGQATYAVKISAASNRTYWIEYRQPIGFDSGFISNGAQVRVASPFEFPCTSCGSDDTQILDMSLGTAGVFSDAALLLGQTYIDGQYGIALNVTNVVTGSAGSLTLSVAIGSPPPTTTTLASSVNPSLVGSSVTFTATVTGTAPTGPVAFTDGGTTITGCGAVSLPAGSANSKIATCPTSAIPAGTRSIVATYAGDLSNSGSISAGLSQVVNKNLSTTGVVSSANPSVALATVSFTATVTGSGPTGPVTFADGGTAISGCAGVALVGSGNSKTATCSTAALIAGAHSIVATYSGDSSNNGSVSSSFAQLGIKASSGMNFVGNTGSTGTNTPW